MNQGENGGANRVSAAWARIRTRYWGVAILLLWGGAILGSGILRLDPYGIEEAAARALLLAWSVTGQVISTVFVLGLPDLRALLFAPLGIYWPGSILAAKVFALLITFAAATLLYKWSRRELDPETALIATGLLLIAPVTLVQADTLGTGPYLLLAFALGHWLDRTYRQSGRPLGGWFFLQLVLILIAVSLHPAGLAYPLALIWEWHRNPVDERQQRHLYIGAGIALVFVMVLRMGWHPLEWLNNPVLALADATLGRGITGEAMPWSIGTVLATALAYIVIRERGAFATDFMRRSLLGGVVLGAFVADGAWAMLALAVTLYLGIPRLIAFNNLFGHESYLRQRGVVTAVLVIAAMLFTQGNKAYHHAMAQNLLPSTDRLILTFALELEDNDSDEETLTMSQWPGKTMLAVKRPVLPLPPSYEDSETLLKNIEGVEYLLFDPFEPANKALSRNLSEATDTAETVVLEDGGVVIRIRQEEAKAGGGEGM